MKLIGFSFGNHKPIEVDTLFKEIGKELLWIDTLGQINDLIMDGDIGILVISSSPRNTNDEIYEISNQLSQLYPNLSLIIIAEDNNLDIRKAMRSGVFDILQSPLSQYQVMETINEAEKRLMSQQNSQPIFEEKKALTKKARIITVCSTKGGVGKTTFSVNLAAAFAKQFKKVAVIDLDLQFGDISMFFDCNPKKTIYEWIKESKNNPKENIQAYLHSYNEYIDIMPAPIRPEFSEVILEEHIGHLITKLLPLYDIVIVDTAPYMEDKILTALERSDDIFLLTFLDLPTLKNSKIFLETLQSLSLDQKVKVILNRDSKKKGLNSSTAETVLGVPIFMKIPDVEKVVAVSVNEGFPYVYSNPRAKISKIIYSLALEISGKPVKQEKKSLFGKKVPQAGRPI
jgi:pilus assembly protein CpaE